VTTIIAPAALASDLTVDGIRLETCVWEGEGEPLLLLHEGLGSVSMWRDFPAQLAERTGRRTIAWSRQGYGLSDLLPGPRAPDYMHREAAAALRFMDVLGIERAVLLGHSDGGSIALLAAAAAPHRVTGLILEAPHVFVEQVTIDSIAGAKTIFETSDLPRRLGRYHQDVDHVFWTWNDIWVDPAFRDWNIESCLPAVRAPALLIQGLDDEYGTLEQLDRIEAALQGTRRLELADCGHSPHRDHPKAVIGAIDTFLRTLTK
jgi:pimeloyl-ACP methyl ester carboxylesterase|tara:strand:- start:6284 stop:7066 length:783 start_codon:yes stop_codon:yes gene_type:complete